MNQMNNVIYYLEGSAKRFPEKVALADQNGTMTYAELRAQGRAVATRILAYTKNSINNPIAIIMDKSIQMLAAYMGVTYSANFYTPLDTSSPVSRLNKIVETLHPALIIVSEKHLQKAKDLGFTEENTLVFETIDRGQINEETISSALGRKIDTDPLYTLFTSGSTGTPKGVTICHRSVIDYTEWVCDTFDVKESDVFGNQAPFYFDNSILDIYSCLKTGATLNIVPEKLFISPGKLIDYLNDNRINSIFWVPSALIYVANSGILEEKVPEYIDRVLFCGEVMPNKQLNQWRRKLPHALYANLYGPTEITDACTYFIVDRPMKDDEPLPIGFPCANTDILVLNDKDELVTAQEECGELCVRGASLALGYYNNWEKTSLAFVQNPLNHAYPELIYRTGDIVKYNERHELIYLSRKDFQIKHMGYRIEIGEIETAVLSLEGVENGCIVYDDQNEKIVLFYQASENIDKQIMTGLRKLLPKYMLPHKLVCERALPLNQNGKINRVELKGRL